MNQLLVILFLSIWSTSFSQIKDTRAELDIYGRINEVSISPNERIWLVSAVGESYFSNSIDSNWHYGPSFQYSNDQHNTFSPHLERISFFNRDTAILTGYISATPNDSRKNGLFLTTNGGLSWETIAFGGSAWIYDAFVDHTGKAWIGGSSGELFYSDNFGKDWRKLNSPYNMHTRMHSIFMSDSLTGIAGALHNSIHTTKDNWATYKKLRTPLDQNNFEDRGRHHDDRIEKVILWGKFIVVNQDGQIFYTNYQNINWQKFNPPIVDFVLDPETLHLYGLTNSSYLLRFSSPSAWDTISDEILEEPIVDLKVKNSSIYLLSQSNEVYKIIQGNIFHSIPYTTDHKIPLPDMIRRGENISWGISNDQVYISDSGASAWYRVAALDFRVDDFRLIDDSTAILWDGARHNYRFILGQDRIEQHDLIHPISTFLKSPVEFISITAASQGCFHFDNNHIEYKQVNDSMLSTYEFTGYIQGRQSKTGQLKKADGKEMERILIGIDSIPSFIPTLDMFEITRKDKADYLEFVNLIVESNRSNFSWNSKNISKEFYNSIPRALDSLSSLPMDDVLNPVENIWSSTSNWLKVHMINQEGDTLYIDRTYYVTPLAWSLPWRFEFQDRHFVSYSLELSRFILSCLPEGFMGREFFDNKYVLKALAEYLHERNR